MCFYGTIVCAYRMIGVLLQDDRCAFTGWPRSKVCSYRVLKIRAFQKGVPLQDGRCAFTGVLKNEAFRRVCPFIIHRVVHFMCIEK